MVSNRKQLSAVLWNKGANLLQILIDNPGVLEQPQINEILIQSIEAYVLSFELMYRGKKRLEVLQEKYANDFLKALKDSETLHTQTDVEAFVLRKLTALIALKDILAKYQHNFTKLETRIYDLINANILKCITPKEIEGRLLRPDTYPELDKQTIASRMQWRQYVLARAEKGAATLPNTQEHVRGNCKSDELPKLAIIENRMQLLCYQPIVNMLATIFKTEDEQAAFKSQKQQAFRDFKNMTSRTVLIVPPPSYKPTEIHTLADSYAKSDIDHGIHTYKFSLLIKSVCAEEKRDLRVKLASCLVKKKEFIEAIEQLKLAYLINLDLEEDTEENYNIYHARGKVILIELMRVIDLYCADLRDTNERNNYQGLESKPGLKGQKLDPNNLLRNELAHYETEDNDRYIQPTVSEYAYGCTLFAVTPKDGLALRDGDFNLDDYKNTRTKPNVQHYVAASIIQSMFRPHHLYEFVAKLTGQALAIPRNADKRIEELEEIFKLNTLQP